MNRLSKITDGLIGQPMFALLDKARQMEKEGRSVIHFEIGDPNFRSPVDAVRAAQKALDDDKTHYTNSMGLQEFRQVIADYTQSTLGFKPSLNQILVCPANSIIDFTARCVVNPGEGVIYPDPGFPTYYSVINYNGMVPLAVPLREDNGFIMSAEDVASEVNDKARLIIINSPHNPTGSVMSETGILNVYQAAKEHDLYLLSDEVYTKIVYDRAHFSPGVFDLCRERTIVLGSLSKAYSMSGWRLGYAIGPEGLIEKMGLLLQTILSCLPPFTQIGGMATLQGDQTALACHVNTLRQRRDLLVDGLNKLPGISCMLPEGAFYAFANIEGTGMTSDAYSESLLQESGVCVLPGNCFGPFGEGYIRLCYASTTVEMIEEALYKMGQFHAKHCLGAREIKQFARGGDTASRVVHILDA